MWDRFRKGSRSAEIRRRSRDMIARKHGVFETLRSIWVYVSWYRGTDSPKGQAHPRVRAQSHGSPRGTAGLPKGQANPNPHLRPGGAGFLFFRGHNVRFSSQRHTTNGGFTLLEVMIASVVMAIIFMGLISSITGAFLTTEMANKASMAQATARRVLEEATQLDYGDMLLLDGNSLITPEGITAKYQVFETSPGLLTLEVEVCRPAIELTVAELAAMDMDQFRGLDVIEGSRIRFTTLSTGMMQRAEVTDQTEAPEDLDDDDDDD